MSDTMEVEHSDVRVEPELSQSTASINDKDCSANFSFLQLLLIPPTDEEKLEYLTINAKFDPVVASIVLPFSDKFKTSAPVANLTYSL